MSCMKKLKKNRNFFILIFLLVNLFLTQFLVFRPNYGFVGVQDQSSQNMYINLNESNSNELDIENDSKISIEKIKNFQDSIFDNSLKSLLENLNFSNNNSSKYINAIFLFEKGINKKERKNLIDSIFENYEILRNFEIIPGIYLKCDLSELSQKANLLSKSLTIRKVYQSRSYSTPYFRGKLPNLGKLNKEDYPNWWVLAIAADNFTENYSDVRVAVIDTGIYSHPDLNIVAEKNFVTGEYTSLDLNGHGTHVGGIVGSDGGGSSGQYRGVAPGVSLVNARAGDEIGGLLDGDIIAAIEWSADQSANGGKADIISMSFGGGAPSTYDPIIQAIKNATDQGVICVAAAGNSGPDYFTGGSPASGPDVITVGATDINNSLASFSSWGPTYSNLAFLDVVAPGVNIISCNSPRSVISSEMHFLGDYFSFPNQADYIPLSGTSMSTPMVAGALAILKHKYPSLTPEAARIALIEGAKRLSDENDKSFVKSGAGLINVSASLKFLKYVKTNRGDENNVSKILPDNLPCQPYDLLNFPGDSQLLNLTIISAVNKVLSVDVPKNIQGIKFSLNKPNINFSDDIGVDFIALRVDILKTALPGNYQFIINLTDGNFIYDSVNFSLDIRLPEHKILMESYHGLNDWYPGLTYYQMGFYDAMKEINLRNISIDYNMQYWTPDYNKSEDNSILTLERLSQYDLVILQNPILPYSPMELNAFEQYFNEGGNILFLGTRYQDLCTENINQLFNKMGTNISVNKETIMNMTFNGFFYYTIYSQGVINFSSSPIFQNVSKFYWALGNTFKVSGNAESVAEINGKTVVAALNGSSMGKGKFVAFGDLYWMYNKFRRKGYEANHSKLLSNLMNYLLPEKKVSITIKLKSERTSNPLLNISIYLKNQTSESPISLSGNNTLTVTIKNHTTYFSNISMNTSYSTYGIYYNNTYLLPGPSNYTYIINVTLIINGKSYNKITRILYVDDSKVPKIKSFSVNKDDVIRGSSVSFTSKLNLIDCKVNAYTSFYSYFYLNFKESINKTFNFIGSGKDYSKSLTISTNDPSGYAITYIVPKSNSSYINPYSPRIKFKINNTDPEIVKSQSIFNDNTFSYAEKYYFLIPPGSNVDFNVKVSDEEDSLTQLRVFLNLFICVVSLDGWIILIYPSTLETEELEYQGSSGRFIISYKIPETMKFDTLEGTKDISAETDYHDGGDYIAILAVTVFDSEGGEDYFLIIISITFDTIDSNEEISATSNNYFIYLILIIAIVSIISSIVIGVVILKKKKEEALIGKTKKKKSTKKAKNKHKVKKNKKTKYR